MKEQNFAPQNNDEQKPERFESDTQKIVRRHLENKDDVITEEDIRNVRVGLSPTTEEIEQHREALDSEIDDQERKREDGYNADPTGNPVTPWDTLQP